MSARGISTNRQRLAVALALAAVVTSPGCARGQPPPEPTDLLVERIATRQSGEAAEASRLVIRDAAAWQAYWATAQSAGAAPTTAPYVDFARNVVVVAATGQRPSGGYRITLTIAAATAGEILIDVVEETPGPSCTTTMSLTYPRDIIVVAGQSKAIRFREATRVRSCN